MGKIRKVMMRMPDWSYQTLFKPLLFLMPPKRARSFTLAAIGTLAKLPGGTSVIELMGHMQPPAALSKTVRGLRFPTPVGLGAGLDPAAKALGALSRFGFGYIELGPVTLAPLSDPGMTLRKTTNLSVTYSAPFENPGVAALENCLRRSPSVAIPLGARLGFRPGAALKEATAEREQLILRLQPYCSFFSLDYRASQRHEPWSAAQWQEHLTCLRQATERPLLFALPPGIAEKEWLSLLQIARNAGLDGIMVAGGVKSAPHDSSDSPAPLYQTGKPSREAALRSVALTRQTWPDCLLIGSGGIIEPADAFAFLEAGADFVQLHSGLVYAGPGLPKRINEAILQSGAARQAVEPANKSERTEAAAEVAAAQLPPAPAARQARAIRWLPAWVWGLLLGLGMIVGGALAWLVAVSTVILPYDERFLQMSAEQLSQISPQLLSFMSHDRISLAGTMISIGIIYAQLSFHGLRHDIHWTRAVLLASGAVGFSSFFLFIGYGYFDYMHAVLALLLLPMFLLALRTPAKRHLPALPPERHNDRTWKMALWGQLLFVVIGFALTGAGLIISLIGITGVFVPSDLVFLCVSAEMLQAFNERLIPLIAHDRAGFGGALVSDGLAVLLISLWGFRRGEAWVWWTLFLAGIPGFAAGIGIHFAVGYVDFVHLLPAYVAVLFFLAGLVLAKPYLTGTVKTGD